MPDTDTRELTGPELILAIRDAIDANPSRLDMSLWVTGPVIPPGNVPIAEFAPYVEKPFVLGEVHEEAPWCGTRFCVAGLAAVLTNLPGLGISRRRGAMGLRLVLPDSSVTSFFEFAMQRMGLSPDVANNLFYAYTEEESFAGGDDGTVFFHDALTFIAGHNPATWEEVLTALGLTTDDVPIQGEAGYGE
jgi:hypothetical protein